MFWHFLSTPYVPFHTPLGKTTSSEASSPASPPSNQTDALYHAYSLNYQPPSVSAPPLPLFTSSSFLSWILASWSLSQASSTFPTNLSSFFFFSFSINLSSKLLSYNSHYVTLLQSSPYKNILSSFGAYHALGYSYLTTWLLQSLNIYKKTLIHVYHTSEHLSSRSILLPPPSLPFKTHAHLTASHLSFRTQLKHKLLQEACFSTRPPQRHTTPARNVSFILWLHLFCCATRCKFTSLFPQLDNELSEGKLCLIHPSILVPGLSLAQCF